VRYLVPGEGQATRIPKKTEPKRPAPGDSGATKAQAPQVQIIGISGDVERRWGNAPWGAARVGDTLSQDEALRTGEHGSANLQVGNRSKLTVTESTEVTVKEITRSLHRFRLAHGRLSVKYDREGDRRIRIETSGGAVAETKEGQFSVLRTPRAVAVATTTGTVDLRAASRKVKVKAGEQAVALDGKPPAPVMAIPKRVLLKIAGVTKEPKKLTQRFTAVEGRTRPGNRVLVGGREVAVDARGRFVVRVPLREGRNRVPVIIEDPSGRRRTKILEYFVVISNEPIENIKFRWHKKRHEGTRKKG
jgi:hypothetical protein